MLSIEWWAVLKLKYFMSCLGGKGGQSNAVCLNLTVRRLAGISTKVPRPGCPLWANTKAGSFFMRGNVRCPETTRQVVFVNKLTILRLGIPLGWDAVSPYLPRPESLGMIRGEPVARPTGRLPIDALSPLRAGPCLGMDHTRFRSRPITKVSLSISHRRFPHAPLRFQQIHLYVSNLQSGGCIVGASDRAY